MACSTNLDDIADLLKIAKEFPNILPSLGWHPWFIDENVSQNEIDTSLAQFSHLLRQHRLPIGEVGLDFHPKWKKTRKQQTYILEYFFDLANALNRPLVLHCVRAHHEILRLLKSYPNTRVYLHHFQGNRNISAQYLRYDAYFGLPILQWSAATNELCFSIPPTRLLIETDELVSLENVLLRIKQHNVSASLLTTCRKNLFRFIQGTSGDFSQQFENTM